MNKLKVKKRIFYPTAWEKVDNQGTNRLRVYGGWIVWSSYGENSECMCFMPDPEHKWKIVLVSLIEKEN